MLSRVFNPTPADIQPLRWRERSQAPPARALDNQAGDAAQLRARIVELTRSAEQQTRQAYETGFKAAEAAARQNALKEVHTTLERLAATVAEVAEARSETLRRAESDAVRLSIEIARRILHRELSVDPAALEALVKAAIGKLQSQEVYRVRVHPDQARVVRQSLEQMGRLQNIEVVDDRCLSPGGVVFEISRGSLDASVATQLSEIERGLVDQLEERG